MDPHAFDLGCHLREVVADADRTLEGGEGVAIDGGAGGTVDELVKRVALSPVGELGPALS
jgi:hypothetical protein